MKNNQNEELNDAFGIAVAIILAIAYFVYEISEGEIYTRAVKGGVVTPESPLFFIIAFFMLSLLSGCLIYILIKRRI